MSHRRASLILLSLALAGANAHAQAADNSMPAMPMAPVALPAPAAAPAVAPTALPEVTVPSVGEPAAQALPAVDSAPAVAAPASAEVPATESAPETVTEKDVPFSFGDLPYSLLYTSAQIDRMQTILKVYETAKRNRIDAPIQIEEEAVDMPDLADIPAAPAEEPAYYPVYTLKSIAYRAPNDWTIWIGDLRITPKTNEQVVRVTAVGPNMAQFLWKPPYREAFQQRAANKLFADTKPVAHKRTATNTASPDSENGQVGFTLRPNQTFAPGYMATFEGKVTPPMMPPLDGSDSSAAPATDTGTTTPGAPGAATPATPLPGGDTSGANPSNLDALLKAQQQMMHP